MYRKPAVFFSCLSPSYFFLKIYFYFLKKEAGIQTDLCLEECFITISGQDDRFNGRGI
jgi:hypothetical protein